MQVSEDPGRTGNQPETDKGGKKESENGEKEEGGRAEEN